MEPADFVTGGGGVRKKRILMYVNLFFIIAVCFLLWHQSSSQIFQAPFWSEEEWKEKMEGKEEVSLPYQLFLEGEKLPTYSSGLGEGYLIPVSEDGSGTKNRISVSEGYEIAFLKTDKRMDMRTAIREMKPIPFLIYNETSYCRGNLFCTSLPVMILDTDKTEYDEEGEELHYGRMVLFEPGRGFETSSAASECEFHIRGISSRSYFKDSYKLNLLDKEENKNKISLLGMRKDDDWILRSLAGDGSKIREKLATDLWNKMNSFGSYHMEYIELFLDGTYWGLYAVQEPMDFKTLQCSREDTFLYKSRCWSEESSFLEDMKTYGRTNLFCGDIEIDKAHMENLDLAYDIMEEYKYFLEGESAGKIQLELDRENLYKLNVFLSAVIGTDNTEKNQFIIADYIGDSRYRIRKLPWDFDLTWGGDYEEKDQERVFDTYIEDRTVGYLMSVEPEETEEGVRSMYDTFSKTVINEEYLLSQAEELFGTLNESGVLMRENEAWDQNISYKQTELLKHIIQLRLIWMKEYYSSL